MLCYLNNEIVVQTTLPNTPLNAPKHACELSLSNKHI